MRNINSHTKTTKRKMNKCKGVFFAYSDVANRYADLLEKREDIISFEANVKLICCSLGDNFTSDFLVLKCDGTYFVRECVDREKLLYPRTLKLLDASRSFWLSKGIENWGIVLNGKR